MRTHIEPLPSLRCNHCSGELRLKELTEPVNRFPELDEEIFVCIKCGREQMMYVMSYDRYKPHLKTP
jgi:uncharacterized protein with PIN domain